MYFPDTHSVQLIFKIDSDAPIEYLNKWNKLKQNCECGKNKDIIYDIINNCKLESNKNLPYLKRSEGGIGGNDNLINKQIRFRHGMFIMPWDGEDEFIIFNEIYNTEDEKWSIDELDDIISAFIKVANKYVNAECVKGFMKLYKNKVDSDSDSKE